MNNTLVEVSLAQTVAGAAEEGGIVDFECRLEWLVIERHEWVRTAGASCREAAQGSQECMGDGHNTLCCQRVGLEARYRVEDSVFCLSHWSRLSLVVVVENTSEIRAAVTITIKVGIKMSN